MIVERNTFVNDDCMHIMKYMSDNCVDMTLTDIPFGVVNRHNGLCRNNMDKGAADIETFNLVFDPCAGSGSTLICSHELGRDFYGIEKNKEYYDKALDRMRSIGVIS